MGEADRVFFPFTTSSFLLGLLFFLDCFFVVDSDGLDLDICAFIGLMDSYQGLPFGLNLLIYLPMCCLLCCRVEQCLFEVYMFINTCIESLRVLCLAPALLN